MFDRIASVYDPLNSVMTAGMHHRWRARSADLAAAGPGSRALDVATGTGDLAIELARRGCEVVGTDFSAEMLEHARAKAPQLRWETANALELPYGDDEFDAATVGFGARNFSDLERGLREMTRVVRAMDGSVDVDPTGKRSGRGAYLCRARGCWDTALKKRALDRALKIEIDGQSRSRLEAYALTQPNEAGSVDVEAEVKNESTPV